MVYKLRDTPASSRDDAAEFCAKCAVLCHDAMKLCAHSAESTKPTVCECKP